MLRLTSRDAASEGHQVFQNRLRLFNPLRLKQGQVSKLIFENDAIRNPISNDFDKWCICQQRAQ